MEVQFCFGPVLYFVRVPLFSPSWFISATDNVQNHEGLICPGLCVLTVCILVQVTHKGEMKHHIWLPTLISNAWTLFSTNRFSFCVLPMMNSKRFSSLCWATTHPNIQFNWFPPPVPSNKIPNYNNPCGTHLNCFTRGHGSSPEMSLSRYEAAARPPSSLSSRVLIRDVSSLETLACLFKASHSWQYRSEPHDQEKRNLDRRAQWSLWRISRDPKDGMCTWDKVPEIQLSGKKS